MTSNTTLKKSFKFVSTSPADTQHFGAALAQCLNVGDVVLMTAGLGSGKTTLTQGLAAELKVSGGVLSPTFIIAQSLSGRKNKKRLAIHHIDFYRLTKTELLNMGIQDYILGEGAIEPGIVLIEWADRFKQIWPKEYVDITIRIDKKKNRIINTTAKGARFKSLIENLKNNL